jgi:hypothetical protein
MESVSLSCTNGVCVGRLQITCFDMDGSSLSSDDTMEWGQRSKSQLKVSSVGTRDKSLMKSTDGRHLLAACEQPPDD